MNVLFFVSGFAGLIYESIWTHYLKLFLGHAAYAQTLVLAIFMGGMAVGAALAARHGPRLVNPLITYAIIEAVIGCLAIAFHPVFVGTTERVYDLAFTHQIDGATFAALKWGLASLLILPQSILLGATFPVFTSAATRTAATSPGRSIATLYFANSMGGAVGVLASGFVLIPMLGLPGTIATAGVLNLAIAAMARRLAIAAMARRMASPLPVQPLPVQRVATPAVTEGDAADRLRLLLTVAFLTGASSFVYEIGWIRMLSLVLGSATHSFELMLSSFILGLALGGLWIRGRIDGAANPGVRLGLIQIAMGCAAIATVPLHTLTFDMVAWTMAEVPKTDGGYVLFNLVRYGLSSLIMFPAAFCAGMTLPLITRILYASGGGRGERAIGLVYSANTIGAITGLALAVHVGLPVIGLEYLVASGALVDVALGVVLLGVFGGRSRLVPAAVVLAGCVAGTVAVATTFNPQKLASGVFRSGNVSAEGKVQAIAHGRTATISVERWEDTITLRTNGKADAAARLASPFAYILDEVTMSLLGAIPLMLHEAPRHVASIGFGSGMTGETILDDPRVERLDTIEIEPKVVDLARAFTGLNDKLYQDPRSVVHIDDAKSFFASGGRTYDIIVSEPSNPWVSGVSGLFSVEFYQHAARYLNDGGMFVQWLHTYEIHPDRVTSILKALDRVFDDYLVISLNLGDVMILARPHGTVAMPREAFSRLSAETRRKLWRLDIANQSDITLRVIGDKRLFRPWLEMRPVPANSDYAPYLDANADHDRFLREGWPELNSLALSAFPIAETLGRRPALPTPSSLSINHHFGSDPMPLTARLAWEEMFGPPRGPEAHPIPSGLPPNLVVQGGRVINGCKTPPSGDVSFAAASVAIRVLPYLSPSEGRRVLTALGGEACIGGLRDGEKGWSTLLDHFADRNPGGFGPVAEDLLAEGRGLTETRAKYLLGMAMLGHVGAGDPGRARAVWERFNGVILKGRPPSLELDIIRAHVGG
ncbi:MAG: fused MFS/spermidine synthase [Alphaproteobacteria bacterium]